MVMNRDSFNGLTEEQQAAVLEAGRDVSLIANGIMLNGSAQGLADFNAVDGKAVIELSAEEAAKFDAASAPVLEQVISEAEAANIPAREYVAQLQGN